ncbi:MAG TPA: TonB-dependent receptor [Propylenella sp.]|nr:TonB-dependent receptor [Propylenella sp.]
MAVAQVAADQVGPDQAPPAQGVDPQVEDAPSTGASPEIIVTAQGRQQRLQDVPISASVTEGEAIQRSNIRNLQDLTERLPNVKLTQSTGADFLNIRGLGSGNSGAFEQSVAVFLDGFYRGRSRAIRAALFDVDRVEVLRGPQTTFFGNNAIAGALSITTRKATQEPSANFSALYGEPDGEFNIEAGATAPLTDTLAIRAAAKFSGMDGYIKNDVLDEKAPRNRDFVGRVSLAFEPSTNWRSDLRLEAARNRDKGASSFQVLNCPPSAEYGMARGTCALALARGPVEDDLDYHTTIPFDTPFNYDSREVSLTNQVGLGEHTLNILTGYFHHKYDSTYTQQPVNVPGVGGTTARQNIFSKEKYRAFSQEVRLASPTGGTLEYMVGAYYSNSRFTYNAWTAFFFNAALGAAAGPPYTADTPVASRNGLLEKNNTYSAFAAATIRPVDSLRVNLGLRYSRVVKNGDRVFQFGTAFPLVFDFNFMPAPLPLQQNIARQQNATLANYPVKRRVDEKLMPSVGVQYDITPDIMGYATFSRGFKAGGFAISGQNELFDPENVDAFEVGLKGSLLDRRLSFNLALFTAKYTGLQESVTLTLPGGGIQSITANVAAARARGVELGGRLRVNSYVTLSADVAYLESIYLNYPNAPCTALQTLAVPVGCLQDLSGRTRAYGPKYSGNVSVQVTVPMGDYRLRFDPSVYFTGGYYQQATLDPLLYQPSYAKVDARLGYGPEDDRWNVALIGKNLTDKVTASFRGLVGTAAGTSYAFVERPRTVAVQVSFKY